MQDDMENAEQKEPSMQSESNQTGLPSEPSDSGGVSRLTRRKFLWVAAGAAATLLGFGIAFLRQSSLTAFLGVSDDTFQLHQGRYFERLRELLAFHGVVDAYAPLGMNNFAVAVRQFQQAKGLAADGIPGENTL